MAASASPARLPWPLFPPRMGLRWPIPSFGTEGQPSPKGRFPSDSYSGAVRREGSRRPLPSSSSFSPPAAFTLLSLSPNRLREMLSGLRATSLRTAFSAQTGPACRQPLLAEQGSPAGPRGRPGGSTMPRPAGCRPPGCCRATRGTGLKLA